MLVNLTIQNIIIGTKMKKIIKLVFISFIKKHYRVFLGIILGMIAGYMYYRFVGCKNGTCMITAHPVRSTLYVGFMGMLIGMAFEPSKKKEKDNKKEEKEE